MLPSPKRGKKLCVGVFCLYVHLLWQIHSWRPWNQKRAVYPWRLELPHTFLVPTESEEGSTSPKIGVTEDCTKSRTQVLCKSSYWSYGLIIYPASQFFKNIFLCMCACMSHVWRRLQKKYFRCLKLEGTMVVGCPMFGIKSGYCTKAVSRHPTISPAPQVKFFKTELQRVNSMF